MLSTSASANARFAACYDLLPYSTRCDKAACHTVLEGICKEEACIILQSNSGGPRSRDQGNAFMCAARPELNASAGRDGQGPRGVQKQVDGLEQVVATVPATNEQLALSSLWCPAHDATISSVSNQHRAIGAGSDAHGAVQLVELLTCAKASRYNIDLWRLSSSAEQVRNVSRHERQQCRRNIYLLADFGSLLLGKNFGEDSVILMHCFLKLRSFTS
mmetsp:Transcript_125463/g.313446  ORF Transcript_125463/g.313446 Transcript_125463/m.313446 type:complete len:217 (-) Transcript_125463:1009-1659(-)